MRLGLSVVLVLACAGLGRAQTPQAVIDRAVKAHGGADALAKTKAMIQTAKGRINVGGTNADATREAKYAVPERYLWSLELRSGSERQRRVIALNGLSGWQQVDGEAAADIPTLLFDIIAEEGYVLWLCTVAPLAQKGNTFTAAAGTTVEGQPADGVTVTRAGKTEVTLYFAKANGLLVKARFRSQEAGAYKEWLFGKHKDFNGVTLPTRLVDIKGAEKMGEWEVADYRFVDKFDAATFRKP